MKRSLSVLVFLAVCSPTWCALIQFEGLSASDSIPLAGMADITTANVGIDSLADALTIEIWNTSLVQTDPAIANPLLTGFGFRLHDASLEDNDVVSWTAVLGSDSSDIKAQYSLTSGTGMGSGLNYFTIGSSGRGSLGRVGNPAAAGETFGIPESLVIFDHVVFTFFFADGALAGLDPSFFMQEVEPNIALRYQSIGYNAADSGSATPGGLVPEPTTLVLVGGALAGLLRMRKRNRG